MASLLAAARSSRPRALALIGLAVALVAVLVVTGARAAVSASPLPDLTAEELVASVLETAEDPPPITGEIATSLELGLPDVSAFGPPEGHQDGLAALAGDQRLRLWRSGDGFRVAQLDGTSERSFTTDGETAWLWDSSELTAERIAVPGGFAGDEPEEGFDPSSADPTALAAQALALAADSTEVTVDPTGRVAGRDTYRLVLTPTPEETLIGRVEIDVDSEERVALRTAVFAREAAAPSIDAGFTSVSFAPIDPATYSFTPPPGANVTELTPGEGHDDTASTEAEGGRGRDDGDRAERRGPQERLEGLGTSRPDVRTFGEGWATVVAIPRPDAGEAGAGDSAEGGEGGGAVADLDALLPFNGPLFSVQAAEVDGQSWLLFGAVGGDVLDRAARDL